VTLFFFAFVIVHRYLERFDPLMLTMAAACNPFFIHVRLQLDLQFHFSPTPRSLRSY